MSRSVVCRLTLGVALLLSVAKPLGAAPPPSQPNPAVSNSSLADAEPVAMGGAATTAATAGQNPTTPAPSGAVTNTTSSPASTGNSIGDTILDLKRFFTVTLDVREEYDDNAFTQQNGQRTASFKEIISPSILFSYPMEDSTFDARYTFTLTHYDSSSQNFDQDHEVVLRYNHAFSDRFNLDLRDEGGYSVDPSLIDAIGSAEREGGYYKNIVTGEFTAQWTPLFGTVTSYSNSFISYENETVSNDQDNDENTVSQDFRFAFWPTVTFAAGVIYDNIAYLDSDRGFTNYTGNVGLDWQALPSLSLGFRIGGSVTEINQGNGASESPYASANINWQLGERSRFIAAYIHSVTPTDNGFSEGQESDRFTANFLYNVTSNITTHFEGIYSHNDITNAFVNGNVTNGQGYTEDIVSFDTGVTYHYNQYVDFEAGYIFSDVNSQFSFDDYTRNEIYVGVRGTY